MRPWLKACQGRPWRLLCKPRWYGQRLVRRRLLFRALADGARAAAFLAARLADRRRRCRTAAVPPGPKARRAGRRARVIGRDDLIRHRCRALGGRLHQQRRPAVAAIERRRSAWPNPHRRRAAHPAKGLAGAAGAAKAQAGHGRCVIVHLRRGAWQWRWQWRAHRPQTRRAGGRCGR